MFDLFSGESLAELYHGSCVSSHLQFSLQKWIIIFVPTIVVLSRYIKISQTFNVDDELSRTNYAS